MTACGLQHRLAAHIGRAANSRWALPVLGLVSFANSSLFPVTPTVLLVPMALADRSRALNLAHLCVATAVLGGLVGYAVGFYSMDTLGLVFVRFYGLEAEYAVMREWFGTWGGWAVALSGFTPAPYKVFALAAGALGMDMPEFIAASCINRGVRFYLVAIPIRYYGDAMLRILAERKILVILGVCAAFAMLWLVGRALA